MLIFIENKNFRVKEVSNSKQSLISFLLLSDFLIRDNNNICLCSICVLQVTFRRDLSCFLRNLKLLFCRMKKKIESSYRLERLDSYMVVEDLRPEMSTFC